MEIKHTIEILTKDIQDIEKLVRNLKNSPSPPQIEIDLAMAKLRNVYELLAIISDDMRTERTADHNKRGAQENRNTTNDSPASPDAEESIQEEKQAEPGGNQQPEKPAQEPANPPSAPGQSAGQDQNTDKMSREAEVQSESLEEERKSKILAEKFAADKSINEKSAPGSDRDLSSRLTGEPIDSIKKTIGINDRFMIIRELLNGDNKKFNDLVEAMDSSQNFEEAQKIIEKEFSSKIQHEGVILLLKLARRKHMGR